METLFVWAAFFLFGFISGIYTHCWIKKEEAKVTAEINKIKTGVENEFKKL